MPCNLVFKEHTGKKWNELCILCDILELIFQLGKFWFYQAIESVFVVAEVEHFEAGHDDYDACKVSLAQIGRLGDPHHEEADEQQAVIDVVLLLNHQIRSIDNDVADDDDADKAGVDDALGREISLFQLRVDESNVILPLAPRLSRGNDEADDSWDPE